MADEDFLKLFKPFYYVNSTFCIRKFRLSTSVFSKTKNADIVFTIIGNSVLFCILCINLHYFISNVKEPFVIFMYILLYIQFFVNFIVVSFENLIRSRQNVLLMAILRDIFKFSYNTEEMNKLMFILFMPCLFYLSAYVVLVGMKMSIDPLWTWLRCAYIFSTIIFDFEILYASFMVYLLAIRTKQWTAAVTYKDTPFDEIAMANFATVIQKISDAVHLLRETFQLTVSSKLEFINLF